MSKRPWYIPPTGVRTAADGEPELIIPARVFADVAEPAPEMTLDVGVEVIAVSVTAGRFAADGEFQEMPLGLIISEGGKVVKAGGVIPDMIGKFVKPAPEISLTVGVGVTPASMIPTGEVTDDKYEELPTGLKTSVVKAERVAEITPETSLQVGVAVITASVIPDGFADDREAEIPAG